MEDPWTASVNPPAVERAKTNAAPDWRIGGGAER
jgi:hypothetical protein